MKKLQTILIVFSFLLLSSGAAFADSFHWDLSVTGNTATGTPAANAGNAINVPNDFTTTGGSTINQTFTGGADDLALDNGDTFTEFGGLNIVATGQHPGDFAFLLDGGTNMYIYYTGLSGSIANFVDGGALSTAAAGATGLAGDSFDLIFDSGVGDIFLYLDDDLDPTNGGTTQVAELELVSGIGTSPDFILGQAEGQFGIVAEFTDVLDGFWNTGLFGDAASQDFDDILNTSLDILAASFNLGATFVSATDAGNGGIDIAVINEGSFVVNVVPEPTTMLLFGFGLLGVAGVTRRKTV